MMRTNYRYRDLYYLDGAIETEHLAILFVTCSFCSFEFSAVRQLSKHMSLERPAGSSERKVQAQGLFKVLAPAFHNNVMASILFQITTFENYI